MQKIAHARYSECHAISKSLMFLGCDFTIKPHFIAPDTYDVSMRKVKRRARIPQHDHKVIATKSPKIPKLWAISVYVNTFKQNTLSVQTVDSYMRAGVDINKRIPMRDGYETPLEASFGHTNVSLFRILLERGAQANILTEDNKTFWDLAFEIDMDDEEWDEKHCKYDNCILRCMQILPRLQVPMWMKMKAKKRAILIKKYRRSITHALKWQPDESNDEDESSDEDANAELGEAGEFELLIEIIEACGYL